MTCSSIQEPHPRFHRRGVHQVKDLPRIMLREMSGQVVARLDWRDTVLNLSALDAKPLSRLPGPNIPN